MSHPVLLHGFMGASSSWSSLLDGLAGAGHRPVLVDLPGHGRHVGETDPSRFTLDAAIAEVRRAGAWPADLIGYSMGARIALHFAAAFPADVRRLVLESGSPGLAEATERARRARSDRNLGERLTDRGIEAFVDEWQALPLFETQAMLDANTLRSQRERRLRNDPESLAAALVGLGTGSLPSLWNRLEDICTPTLLLVGEYDLKFVDIARGMAERMPDARVVLVPACGHAVHLEQPASWTGAVTEFLAE